MRPACVKGRKEGKETFAVQDELHKKIHVTLDLYRDDSSCDGMIQSNFFASVSVPSSLQSGEENTHPIYEQHMAR